MFFALVIKKVEEEDLENVPIKGNDRNSGKNLKFFVSNLKLFSCSGFLTTLHPQMTVRAHKLSDGTAAFMNHLLLQTLRR